MTAYHIFHDVLLAVHNLALVICAGAPFFWWFHWLASGDAEHGARFVEKTFPWVALGFVLLFITGIGMPVGRILMSGGDRIMHPVAGLAIKAKVGSVVALMVVMALIRVKILKPAASNPEHLATSGSKLRLYLKLAMLFSAGSLFFSAWIRFGMC